MRYAGAEWLQLIGVTRMTDLDNCIVEFSTNHIPEKDRIAFWREHYGHVMLRADLEPARDAAFEARIASLALPGLQLMEASSSPAKISRSGRYLADGNDDVVVAVNRTGSVNIASGGREQSLREGEAIVLSGGEATSFHRTSIGRSITLRVSLRPSHPIRRIQPENPSILAIRRASGAPSPRS